MSRRRNIGFAVFAIVGIIVSFLLALPSKEIETVSIKHKTRPYQAYWLCPENAIFRRDYWEIPVWAWKVGNHPYLGVLTLPNSVNQICVYGDFERGSGLVKFENVPARYNFFLSIPDLPAETLINQYPHFEVDVSIYRIDRVSTNMNSDDFDTIIEDIRL